MIDAVTTSSSDAAAAMKKSTGLNKDDFMKLFVTQLQYQDPLNPQDSSEFIAQLSQLTQVEQAYNTNTNLQSLLNAFSTATTLSSVSFIGKEIEATGDNVTLSAGSQPSLKYQIDSTAQKVAIDIKDAAGTVIRTIEKPAVLSGTYDVTWDGLDDSGRAVYPGTYYFSVTGYNADGSTFDGTPLVSGKVDAVRMDGTSAVLSVGGKEVLLSDVIQVKGGTV